jgi:ubiquinone/menaquinone biosynthesis C-methylase UbiE
MSRTKPRHASRDTAPKAGDAGDRVTSAGIDKEQASRRTFDRWAAVFDRSLILRALRARALRELGELSPDDRFLDIACGAGRLVFAAAPQVERAVGLDLAPKMIERARSRADARSEAVEFHVGSVQDLPFGDGEFTVITCTTAFHHFPDPPAAVTEIARVLAPGGRVLLADMISDTPPIAVTDAVLRRVERGHVRFHESADLEAFFSDAGLAVVRTRRALAWTYAFLLATKQREMTL